VKRVTYGICSAVLAELESTLQQHDMSGGPIRSVADMSGEVSTADRATRRRERAASADRRRLTLVVTAVAPTTGNAVLKEEPVKSPLTIHTAAAYFVTTIKLYATFSIYFRVYGVSCMVYFHLRLAMLRAGIVFGGVCLCVCLQKISKTTGRKLV